MNRRSFPRIDPADLRDHADDTRIGRIWEGIEADLASVEATASWNRRSVFVYAAVAATFVAFGAGVFVGKAGFAQHVDPVTTKVTDRISVDVLAAGSQSRSFPLPGGGKVTLSPGTTVEVTHAPGDAPELQLLQGEAAVDTSGTRRPGIAIVAGEARVATQAGSVLSVRRNADELDVSVSDGNVSVSSPSGSQQLGRGESAVAIPTHNAIVTNVPVTSPPSHRPRLPLPRRPRVPRPTPKLVAPEWLVHYDANDYDGAIAILKKQNIAQTIDQAKGAKELIAIADLVRSTRDRGLEVRAYERLVRDFPSDQRASLAADHLAKLYDQLGQPELAKLYRDQVHTLVRTATTGADSLLCNYINGEMDKTKAALAAKEYLDKYPDGECHDKFERMLQGDGLIPTPEPEVAPPLP